MPPNPATRAPHATKCDDGRIRCEVCPRFCTLREGQRGLCYVRQRAGDEIVLTTYGRSSGFVLDPIEKKPLGHFLPGSSVLSFGTAGCNLACKFCQNWDISKARSADVLQNQASPEAIARSAEERGVTSVAFTYNDPVIFLEYASDTARACRARGIETVAVTAGYVTARARPDLFRYVTAANVDLKAFTNAFYRDVAAGQLQPVLDTLTYLAHETDIWFEITTLLIPGKNDGDDEIRRAADWILDNLGPDVPLHFSAFHPDFKMRDVPATPPDTVRRARRLAMQAGLHFVYTGNIRDLEGGTTFCPGCRTPVIVRDGYEVLEYHVVDGACAFCQRILPGKFEDEPGQWGRKRVGVFIR